MKSFLFTIIAALVLAAGTARAQQAWVQIEALQTLAEAEQRARAWTGAFSEVNGFRLGSGWYAVTLGPYTPEEAASRLAALRRERLIPSDSFVADGRNFRDRFWPVGQVAPAAPQPQAAVPEVLAEPEVLALPDETPAEARRSEATLDADARRALQTALQWFGFYDAAIDGAFGRGTRASMAAWQQANGYEATGILTTRQRAALLEEYQGAVDALGLGQVVEERAGISLTMPIRLVEFDDYAPPFVRYREKDGSGVQVLLISQEGNQATLDGLFDVMQTLEVVPVEGFRERQGQSFVLTGQNEQVHSYTYARLQGGMVKGFTLVYPPAEEAQMQKAIAVMRDTFTSTGPALDPTLGDNGNGQARDLLSGLEVRQPERTRSGVYVGRDGSALTVAEAVDGCGRVTLDDRYEVEVVATDPTTGLALLRPKVPLAPPAVARLADGDPRIGAQAAVGGYPFGPALPAATLTFGTVEDVAGLGGEPGLLRLQAGTEPGDAGGPVFDRAGRLAAILLPDAQDATRQLPPGVRFAAKADAAVGFLAANGVSVTPTPEGGALAPEDLAAAAMQMTVLVSCWQ